MNVKRLASVKRLRTISVLDVITAAVSALADVAEANRRKLSRGHASALHDVRVAVRRIRTLLRAYQANLPPEYASWRKELSAAMRQTNLLRDLEVHSAMLARIMGRRQTPGAVIQALVDIRTHVQNLLRHVGSRNHALARALEYPLRELTHTVKTTPGDTLSDLYFVTTATIVQREMRTLTRLGQTVGRVSEVNRLHRTRLTAKRIRYVIEPLPHQLPGVRDATNRLKRLQALLGEIRDLQTLRQSMARYARSDTLLKRQDIQAASRIVRNEEERLFRTFLHRRERGEIARLGQRLSSLVERLRQ